VSVANTIPFFFPQITHILLNPIFSSNVLTMRLSHAIFACIFLLFSCKKEGSVNVTVDTVKATLTNDLSKTWSLNKLYVNGTQTTLTAGQARYTKTFKVDNTWLDSDGYLGTYSLPNPQAITELVTNQPGGSQTITYKINTCTTTQLDVEYTQGTTVYRLVFIL
jgi:hypothetical protein